jgi:hypothetical protein
MWIISFEVIFPRKNDFVTLLEELLSTNFLLNLTKKIDFEKIRIQSFRDGLMI